MIKIDSKIPEGPVAEKWTNYKAHQKLVNPANKRRLDIIVVGTGLAGASAAASLGEMGFRVFNFCIQDSPRRAHSIAAQGGINAAKNYQNDGDSVYRLFYDTVKGGDYRAREANVYRLAEVSNAIIDQCVAQGVPFAREYGGTLDNRSFGGAQVSRTFYAKGQTGQQLLLGAYSALSRQVNVGTVKLYTRYEMQDVVIVDGRARGIIAKNLVTGKLERFAAHAVVIATGGYGNAYFLSTNAMGCNCTAAVSCYRKGAVFANPAYVQIHPTCIPVHGDKQSKLTLVSLGNAGNASVPVTQDRKVTGIITDERGEPIIGANVVVKGTSKGTVTDLNGEYSIEANGKSILLISYIGYLSEEVAVGNNKTLNIQLKEDAQKLDEVVVIGYGTQKRSNLSGAISKISSEVIDSKPVTNVRYVSSLTRPVRLCSETEPPLRVRWKPGAGGPPTWRPERRSRLGSPERALQSAANFSKL